MTIRTKIFLTELKQPFLLVEAPTGVIYEHQLGGVQIQHFSREGFLIPLNDAELQETLTSIATFHGLEAEHAAVVRDALHAHCQKWERDWIWVDEDRLSESDEAWVYVGLDKNLAPNALRCEEGDLPTTAILLWQNSD